MIKETGQSAKILSFIKKVNIFLKKEKDFSLTTLEKIQKSTKELLDILETKIVTKKAEIPKQVEEAIENRTIINLQKFIEEDKSLGDMPLDSFLEKFITDNLVQHIRKFADGEDLSIPISKFLTSIVLKINGLYDIRKMKIEHISAKPKYSQLILIFDNIYINDLKTYDTVYHASLYSNAKLNFTEQDLFISHINVVSTRKLILLEGMKGNLPDGAIDLGYNHILFLGNLHYSMEEIFRNLNSFIHPKDMEKETPKNILTKAVEEFAETLRLRGGLIKEKRKKSKILR